MAPATSTLWQAAGRALLRLEERPGPLETPCWVWTGAIGGRGYGYIHAAGKIVLVHRLLYAVFVSEPDPAKHVHHRCEVTACANPAHLEELTPAAHVLLGGNIAAVNARKTHCLKGHRFTKENTLIKRTGERRCRRCHREGERARREAA